MASMTTFFTAAEQIDTAQLTMARSLDEIRGREGTLTSAATMLGLTTGEARKLLALLSCSAQSADGPNTGDGSGTAEGDAGTAQ